MSGSRSATPSDSKPVTPAPSVSSPAIPDLNIKRCSPSPQPPASNPSVITVTSPRQLASATPLVTTLPALTPPPISIPPSQGWLQRGWGQFQHFIGAPFLEALGGFLMKTGAGASFASMDIFFPEELATILDCAIPYGKGCVLLVVGLPQLLNRNPPPVPNNWQARLAGFGAAALTGVGVLTMATFGPPALVVSNPLARGALGFVVAKTVQNHSVVRNVASNLLSRCGFWRQSAEGSYPDAHYVAVSNSPRSTR